MIEDELVIGEPYNFVKVMAYGWFFLGLWYIYDDFYHLKL
jgi:hypothetical protein